MSDGKDDSGTTAAVACSGPPTEIADSGTMTQSEEKIDDSTSTEFADSTASSTTTIGYPIADSGTFTKMEAKFDQDLCVCMWVELDDAKVTSSTQRPLRFHDGKVTNFEELADLMVRNMKEYVATGDVLSGKLPFAVQFCSPGWLPWVKKDQLIKLREFFCQMTRDAIFYAIKDDTSWYEGAESGRNQLKKTLEELNILKGVQAVRSWHGATCVFKLLCVGGCVPIRSGVNFHNGLAPS
jgi:hypothetical protein